MTRHWAGCLSSGRKPIGAILGMGRSTRRPFGFPTSASQPSFRTGMVEKGGLMAFPGAGGVGFYFSGDGLRWEPCPIIPQDVPKSTFFNLDATIGNVSYTQNNQLYVAERQGMQIFELPEGVRCAAATESGDWVAVGRDCNDKGVLWNQRKMACILRKGVTA